MSTAPRYRIRISVKRAVCGLAAVLLLGAFPGSAIVNGVEVNADAAPTQQCSPVAPAPTGTSQPTGSAAGTYHYNSCTGLWENDHYTYNPATRQYAPKPGSEPTYTCDTSTYTWQVTQWNYVASHNDYELQTSTIANPPAGSVSGTCQAPVTTQVAPATAPASGDPSVTDTDTSSTTATDTNNVSLTTNLNSTAQSGNVTLSQNTSAGNATSGNASAAAQIINTVNTSSSLNGGQVVTFTKNIDGDVNGDLIIDPNQLQPANANVNTANNVTLNAKTSGTITNNVNLSATSGDVTASENTKVGNAASGNAAAVADVVNMLNSYISAGQSFIGTININGNLHGDILMPPKFLTSLVASGAPHTAVNLSDVSNNTLTAADATTITNQINSQATSGSVDQSQNTSAGNATSGSASTSVEIYNLTGHQIVGGNSLLVFVNVMGTWVGVILDAPAGTTSALLGGNITANTADNQTVTATADNAITNNISVAASSGDVSSTRNTLAGSATSGNASTDVNLANFSNDSLDLSGWFGILFINVFGSWYGNFGVAPVPAAGDYHGGSPAGHATPTKPAPVFRFVPQAAAAGNSGVSPAAVKGGSQPAGANLGQHVLAARTIKSTGGTLPATGIVPDAPGGHHIAWGIVSGALVLAAGLFLASRKATSR